WTMRFGKFLPICLGFDSLKKVKEKGSSVDSVSGQTEAGRYLIVFFIYKLNQDALVISARNMDRRERRRYGRK
ncbi:MAG: hypothetical protein ACE5PV_24980, partial [Candidatus Poribacteria bacterium]